jgi:hypothetical protein
MEPNTIVEVNHLKKYYKVNGSGFRGKEETVKALDDISFEISAARRSALWGIRLRQNHRGPRHPPPDRRDGRRDSL